MGRRSSSSSASQRGIRRPDVESKAKAKYLKSLDPGQIEWGQYNHNFQTSGTAGEKELHQFLQGLEELAQFPEIKSQYAASLVRKYRSQQKLVLLPALYSDIPKTPSDDIVLLTDANSLEDALKQPFDIPLLHRASAKFPPLTKPLEGAIRILRDHLSDAMDSTISVYDYSIDDPNERTRKTTVEELNACFLPGHARKQLNFLDIENRLGIQFCPQQISIQNVMTKLNAQKDLYKGLTEASRPQLYQAPEFLILSLQNAISTVHVDTGAANTWFYLLEGRKIWYFPRQADDESVRWLGLAGSQETKYYEKGWVKVELRPGDLFIMPPSYPHAVFSPEDCLGVGGQFYTVSNLGRTLRGLKLQEDYGHISNEDLKDSIYTDLSEIIKNIKKVSQPEERARISKSGPIFYQRGVKGPPNPARVRLVSDIKALEKEFRVK